MNAVIHPAAKVAPSAEPAPIHLDCAAYWLSAHQLAQLPPDAGAEVAFAGRSNVGKSSAINAITRRRRLAHTGKTPGRTRQIVFFRVDDARRLVDLPGYGYANVARSERQRWRGLVDEYLTRRCLRAVVIPMDIRRPLTEMDWAMLDCCRQLDLAVHILLTKADKYKRGAAQNALLQVRAQLAQSAPAAIAVQLFSARDRQGVADADAAICGWLRGGGDDDGDDSNSDDGDVTGNSDGAVDVDL